MGAWRVGVVADTHNRVSPAMFEALIGVDEVWHLGDVVDEGVLDSFWSLGVPLTVVRGNNDFADWPLTVDLDREGWRLHLVHIPPRTAPRCDVVLHGHTHVPRDEVQGGVRWLNPGPAGLANKGAPRSLGRLVLAPGRLDWSLVRI